MEQVCAGEGFHELAGVKGPGVYLLAWKGEVMYVGQAKKVINRICAHSQAWDRYRKTGIIPADNRKAVRFDQVFIRPCAESDLDRVERQMIAKFNPRWNKNHKVSPKPEMIQINLVAALGLRKASEPVRRRF
jgi:excinuclease UvrABC nuclease subunit